MSRANGAAHAPAFNVSEADARDYYVTGAEIAVGITRMLDATTAGTYHVLRTGIAQLDRDVTIAPGTVTAILGRPSMGKSTLIRTLLGHVAQRDGHITLFGKDASRFKPHEVARLGVVTSSESVR